MKTTIKHPKLNNNQTPGASILIVEDEVGHAEAISEGLDRVGHTCEMVHTGDSALAKLATNSYDIVITDLMLGPGPDGLAVLEEALKQNPAVKVILITAHSSVDTCRTALQNGAFDYIQKPLNLDELRVVVSRAAELTAQRRTIRELRQQLDSQFGFDSIIGRSAGMVKLLDMVRRVARSDISTLILGESGTGKELLAKAIWKNSNRADKKFVAINCAGLSETLLEDELFGHVKGAYTGATTDRAGRFEHAHGGSLFLDEVGDMPLAMQAKLLRVLENGEVVRVGANEPIKIDVRIISATNCDLQEKVAKKEFREDLYFRIKGATLNIPSLQQRRDDIPLLIDHFIKQANESHKMNIKSISAETKRLLMGYNWPGNVRQLRNVVENMVVLAADDKITIDDLPAEVYSPPEASSNQNLNQLCGISLKQAEKLLIENTLKMTAGNREKAATILEISERSLYRKIKDFELKA